MTVDREQIRKLVDEWPPLTASQRDRLRPLLGSARPPADQSTRPVARQGGGDHAAA